MNEALTQSSGNLFADIGVRDPDEASVKAKLAGFSIDRLLRFLTVLGSDIEIVVKDGAKHNRPGYMKVAVA